MKVRIIVDSTADLNPAIQGKLTVVPLSILFGEEAYVDGVTMTHQAFYEKLIAGPVMPTTSQPTPDSFAKVFEQVQAAGEEAVVITISSKLSGTCQSALIAAADFENIYVIDSKSVALGSGILAEYALQLAESGMTAQQIVSELEQARERVQLVALLDTLEYLKRGGRISKTAAVAGSLLSIKPVIGISDGEIKVLGKARGSKQGNTLLIKQIEEKGGMDIGKPMLVGYTGLNDAMMQQYIAASAYLWEGNPDALHSTVVGSVVGTHAGPGAVAVGFFSNK